MSSSPLPLLESPPVESDPSETTEPQADAVPWPLPAQIGFRFALVYFLLQMVPWPLSDWIPPLGKLYSHGYDWLMPWIGHHWLGITGEIPTAATGSGDKTVDWINQGVCTALALLMTLLWSLMSSVRRRGRAIRYHRMYELLRIYVRYFLSATMLGYGVIKLFKGQFPDPTPYRLVETYGDSSPMGLLWTFMGQSAPYVIFSGFGETLGAVLILFRRTTTLGALILTAVLTNVVMLNFCYDVPVKLGSSNFLALALFILIPDLRRLANVLLFNRTAFAQPQKLLLPRRWMRIVRILGKTAIVAYLAYTNVKGGIANAASVATTNSADSYLSDLWSIEGLKRNGVEVPLLSTDDKSWHRVNFGWGHMFVVNMDGSRASRYSAVEDEPGKESDRRVTVTPLDDANQPIKDKSTKLVEKRTNRDHLVLTGPLGSDSIELRLRRIDTSKSLLRSRGFHWINEVPFNR